MTKKAIAGNITIGILSILGIAACFIFDGCSSQQKAYWQTQYTSVGKCFWYDNIDRQRWGKERCFVTCPNMTYLNCNRQEGHRGKHHCHDWKGNCLAIWK